MADTSETSKNSDNKKKTGGFPRQPLKKVLELTDAIFNEGHGEPVRRRTAFEKINKSPDSSTSYYLLQAANGGYSLVNGNKNSSHLELTEKGISISNPKSPKEKISAIYDILFSNQYFTTIIDRYKEKPFPNDQLVIDYLEREQKLSQTEAQECWSVVKQNINDYSLIEESGNKKIIIDKEHALKINGKSESTDNNSDSPSDEKSDSNITQLNSSPTNGSITQENYLSNKKHVKQLPQITFNIQVVLPENATPEVYEAIFSSMSTHLLGRDEE